MVIVALAFYAGMLLRRLQLQKLQQKQQQLALQQQQTEKRRYLTESITLICRAMLEQQCELSEGALRVWVLLDHLVPERQPDPVQTYPGLHQMYQVVKDMPTHEARKRQSKQQTYNQDKLRLAAEQQLKDFILADAKALLQRLQPAQI
ncbi:MAG: DUF2489 domain-containing protein [Gammaproteobacteria bacterium]|nr:DUF2489 domain-containing protein [Gammaproteobacteria bacterium]MBU1554883.1 DUF2489 domain-containing protein [Gammaproteobacteria bacterium]MBU2069471.1 DUF2489 domain-containing protein [Gammaproteobacteria bacterium]MBU2182975.1 DUF2489 domain-containing protein [Gammaproteobacteria bacterium]MBU2203245.1 DUF2489 domain-containing protein [Gammaproteobacteria bacterium]